MQKTKIITTIIVLFAFIFTYLHAIPLPLAAIGGKVVASLKKNLHVTSLPSAAKGDKFVVVLKKLDGKFEFKELSNGYVSAYGIINKCITENAPEHYFIKISKGNFTSTASFYEWGIPIHPPKAGPWGKGNSYEADIDKLIDAEFSILKDDKVLDSAKVVKK
ncbi:hypothetical protein F8M41_008087 [Gigaspora margarita]|uniref:Uncharacterized protein n=1 Tax=Gigaspora margarita TaxID=4874 RepID=A0A8H3X3Y5_GIGMA|nr:hypothetical protein F8M41_008087 [Gigaspora margarita]